MYEQYLARSMSQAERKTENAFHCKTPDCAGWCIFEDNVNEFRCPVCKVTNCLTCQVRNEDVPVAVGGGLKSSPWSSGRKLTQTVLK